ncbi:MAG: hypothetical protein WC603_02905 [Candidatus Paceibacterota bacterium]|jgi:hypothetical protein
MSDEITPKEEVTVEAPIEPVPASVKDSSEAMSEPIETIPSEPEIPAVEPKPTLNSTMESGATAQIPGNEPLDTPEEKPLAPSEPKKEIPLEPTSPQVNPASNGTGKNLARELLVQAKNAIQSRKRKKLDKIMTLFAKQTKITNDEVEKLLHVSDATATRYLSQLEKEGKIKQNGKIGKSVFYFRI